MHTIFGPVESIGFVYTHSLLYFFLGPFTIALKALPNQAIKLIPGQRAWK